MITLNWVSLIIFLGLAVLVGVYLREIIRLFRGTP